MRSSLRVGDAHSRAEGGDLTVVASQLGGLLGCQASSRPTDCVDVHLAKDGQLGVDALAKSWIVVPPSDDQSLARPTLWSEPMGRSIVTLDIDSDTWRLIEAAASSPRWSCSAETLATLWLEQHMRREQRAKAAEGEEWADQAHRVVSDPEARQATEPMPGVIPRPETMNVAVAIRLLERAESMAASARGLLDGSIPGPESGGISPPAWLRAAADSVSDLPTFETKPAEHEQPPGEAETGQEE
jgi:hypothetical protein